MEDRIYFKGLNSNFIELCVSLPKDDCNAEAWAASRGVVDKPIFSVYDEIISSVERGRYSYYSNGVGYGDIEYKIKTKNGLEFAIWGEEPKAGEKLEKYRGSLIYKNQYNWIKEL